MVLLKAKTRLHIVHGLQSIFKRVPHFKVAQFLAAIKLCNHCHHDFFSTLEQPLDKIMLLYSGVICSVADIVWISTHASKEYFQTIAVAFENDRNLATRPSSAG
jgi:hypothetical protein